MKKHIRFYAVVALVLALSMALCACDGSADDKTMSIGTIDGYTYTNTYVGFTMTLDSGWTIYPAEELQDLPENIADLMEGSEIGDAMDSLEQFTDVLAENLTALTTINVLYQKLDLTTKLSYAAMSEEAIVDAVLAQSDMMIDGYAQAGIDVEKMEKVNVTFLGQPRVAIATTAAVSGTPYYILQIYDFHLGDYSSTITFGSFEENKTMDLLKLCQPIGE